MTWRSRHGPNNTKFLSQSFLRFPARFPCSVSVFTTMETFLNGRIVPRCAHGRAKSVAYWALHVSASTAVVAAPQVLRVEAKISGHMLAWFWPIRARS